MAECNAGKEINTATRLQQSNTPMPTTTTSIDSPQLRNMPQRCFPPFFYTFLPTMTPSTPPFYYWDDSDLAVAIRLHHYPPRNKKIINRITDKNHTTNKVTGIAQAIETDTIEEDNTCPRPNENRNTDNHPFPTTTKQMPMDPHLRPPTIPTITRFQPEPRSTCYVHDNTMPTTNLYL